MKIANRKVGVVVLVWITLVVLGVLGRGLKTHAQAPPPTYPAFPVTASSITYTCPPGPWCYDCTVGAPTAGCSGGARPAAGYTRSDCQGGGWTWNVCTGTSFNCGTYTNCTTGAIIGPCMNGNWCK